MTLGEYVFRVVVSLLGFTGIGLTIFWGLRAIGFVHPESSRRGGSIDDDP